MDRQRLTITLRKDLLKEVDEAIDGAKIRNRSHAIEYLLTQALRPTVERAVILAGGKGVQMRPFTYEMPKTMLPVGGRPILEYAVERLRKAGVRNITIVIGHLGEKIRDHFGDGSAFGVRIDYFEQQGETIGTAYPLTQIRTLQKGNPFFVMYGDTLADIDLQDLFETHDSTGAIMTAALTSVEQPGSFGVASLRGYKIVRFDEKPGVGKSRTHLVSAGVFVCSPGIVNVIPKKKTASIEKDVLPHLAGEGLITGYPFEGRWYDVGTPEIYEKVIQEWV
ncbi:MAG: NTP transferase domain-containing protein [Candidatus Doudnabacteria bacterium]|nr:NTP transferase domain-containing protein [Candidatus Doudnabacteria bacterium]MCA9387975.1 NTP transferase domain-containing protein [Candidatus Andersenbacteria bacterium]